MRLLRTAVVVLLFVSVLTNVLLVARGAGRSPDDPPSSLPQERTRAHAQLETERERNEVLRERIRELEARAATPGVSGPSSVPAEGRSSRYRDRFRRSIPLVGENNTFTTPETYLVISEATLELFRASVGRARNPADYGECLRELFDAIAEDKGLKLDGERSKELRRILEDYREALLRASSDSVAERNVQELEAEASVMTRTRTLLDEEQHGRIRNVFSTLGLSVQPMSYWGLTYEFPEDTLVSAWTESYRLDETQKPAALAAARGFADALRELAREYRGREDNQGIGSQVGYEKRLAGQRAQLSALKVLENILTPEQKKRLHSQTLTEFNVSAPSEAEK